MFFSVPVLAELEFKALLDKQGDSLFSGVLSVLVLILSVNSALCAVFLVPCWRQWFVQNQEAAKTDSINNLLLKLWPWCSACTAKRNFLLQAACQAGKSDFVNSRNKLTFWGDCSAGREALEPRASLRDLQKFGFFTYAPLAYQGVLCTVSCGFIWLVTSTGRTGSWGGSRTLLWVSVWAYSILNKFCFLRGSSDAAGNCTVGFFFWDIFTFWW